MSGDLRQSKSPSQSNPHLCTKKRKMHVSRRSSVDTCSTEVSSKLLTPGKNGRSRYSMPALSSNSLASHPSSTGANWEHLAQESPHLLTTNTNRSTNSSFVSLDPPITRGVLSELDIPRLENDLVLRHHLNFDSDLEFRVKTTGAQAEERQERAVEYWNALATEIALWLAPCRKTAACPSSQRSCVSSPRPEAKVFPRGRTSRFSRLFEAVRDILKRSLPSEEWTIIDARLDVKLLVQQLEHGICDLTALSDWLGNFVRRFCSPARECLLHTMTSAIRSGVENAEADTIVHGFVTIFEILQAMNLVSRPTVSP